MFARFAFLAVALVAFSASRAEAQQPVSAAALQQPPQPVPGSCRAPSYPALLRASQIEGRVILEFVVDTTGQIERETIRAISSSHSQFEAVAKQALMTCRYRPASFNQQLARVLVRMPYTFTIGRS